MRRANQIISKACVAIHAAPRPASQAHAARLIEGPIFAHGMTKTMLNQEWCMSLEQAIESEAQAQAICMQTRDFERAYNAFVGKQSPVLEGN